jgi:hypothetical protein
MRGNPAVANQPHLVARSITGRAKIMIYINALQVFTKIDASTRSITFVVREGLQQGQKGNRPALC